jgi:NAD(P)-dependent dehydrogenase (short-subunit alcohol dehydrogenase family)
MKHAIVWGASGGIGRALAAALAQDGWSVVGVARRAENLTNIVGHVVEADVSDDFSVRQAALEIAQVVGEAQLFVYAVGDILSRKVSDLGVADWRRILDANLTGAFLTTHHSLPLLTADAHLIYIGAVHERLRLPGLSAYAAAKTGLEAFAEALAKEERKRRVTVIRPSAVATPLWEKMPVRLPKNALSPEQLAQRILALHNEGQTGVIDS